MTTPRKAAGDTVDLTGQVREIDDAFLAELQLFDGADRLALGDSYVQVEQIAAVDRVLSRPGT